MLNILEIELGPHFVTFYSAERVKLWEFAPIAYKAFMSNIEFKDLWDIQQLDFKHVDNDPKVYHPYGEPNGFRAHYTHFHIRTDKKPSIKLAEQFKDFLATLGAKFPENVPITFIEQFRTPDKLDYKYPTRRKGESYLDYIERIKNT